MIRSFHMMVFRLYQSHRNHVRPLMQTIGLSAGQPKILNYVREHDGCMLKEVAYHCEIRPATTSRIIEKLLREGHLVRTPLANDRRAMALRITEQGRQALKRWDRCCQQVEDVMLKDFDETEKAQFYGFLNRAYANFNAAEKRGEPDA